MHLREITICSQQLVINTNETEVCADIIHIFALAVNACALFVAETAVYFQIILHFQSLDQIIPHLALLLVPLRRCQPCEKDTHRAELDKHTNLTLVFEFYGAEGWYSFFVLSGFSLLQTNFLCVDVGCGRIRDMVGLQVG